MGNLFLCAIMYPNQDLLDKTLQVLENEFRKVKVKGEEYDFNFTKYYQDEFGESLKKIIVIFEKTIEKIDLIQIRERTGEIEQELSKDTKRTVNIDPGYISSTELVLATKKGKDFKENLGKGVYAHRVLEFRNGEILTFKHTFADYKIEKNWKLFRKICQSN